MSGMQRRKGAVGEREVVAEFDRHGMLAHRTAQRMGKAGDAADVQVAGLDVHIEVKRTERFSLTDAIAQASTDSNGRPWIIVHRSNGRPWMVIQPFHQWAADSASFREAKARNAATKPQEATDAPTT